jgi:hypothetical protein
LRRSKTDQEGAGRRIGIPPRHKAANAACCRDAAVCTNQDIRNTRKRAKIRRF